MAELYRLGCLVDPTLAALTDDDNDDGQAHASRAAAAQPPPPRRMLRFWARVASREASLHAGAC